MMTIACASGKVRSGAAAVFTSYILAKLFRSLWGLEVERL